MRTTLAPIGRAPRWARIIGNALAAVVAAGCLGLAVGMVVTAQAAAQSTAVDDDDGDSAAAAVGGRLGDDALRLALDDEVQLTDDERKQAVGALEARLKQLRGNELRDETWVLIIGLVGQSFFFLRFFLQWITSERRRQSVVPISFWYSSLAAALLVLVYGFLREDPVIIIGQSAGFFIYTRNLVLIGRRRRQLAEKLAARAGGTAVDRDLDPTDAGQRTTTDAVPFSLVFCGTQGTGKTTLARAVAERFGLPLEVEAARVVAEAMGLARMDDLTPAQVSEFHSRILEHQVAALDAAARSGARFVGDRCVIDTAAHVRFLMPPDEAAPLLERARQAVARYSRVCYLPPEIPPQEDGFRRNDPEWRDNQDQAIVDLLREWEVPHEVVRGTLEARVMVVGGLLRDAGVVDAEVARQFE